MNKLAPIVLFVYNRPEHTYKALESLMANGLAEESELFIYADGPKPNAPQSVLGKISEVRKIIRVKKWCGKVNIIESAINRTLPVNLVEKVTEIINKHGKIIVLEDDLVLAKGFLKYMNDALNLYENEKQVMHISGYMYPVKTKLPDTFFLKLATCWGWATWQRAWSQYNSSADDLLKFITPDLKTEFDMGYPHYEALVNCCIGESKSWDIRWHGSVFVNGGLCLHPHTSLVRNIGFDGSGLHCGKDIVYLNQEMGNYEDLKRINLKESKKAKKAIVKFYLSFYPRLKVFIRQILFGFLHENSVAIKKKWKKLRGHEKMDWYQYNDLLSWWGKDNVWKEIQIFFEKEEGKFLDIGCGNGIVMDILSKNSNKQLYGCDIAEKLLAVGIKMGIDKSRLQVCNVTDLNAYSNNFFDYTYSIGLLQYFKDDELSQAISEISRITKNKSLHMVPVSFDNKNYGWIKSWQKFQNNSSELWCSVFQKYFARIDIIDSAWKDEWSAGKWIICIK